MNKSRFQFCSHAYIWDHKIVHILIAYTLRLAHLICSPPLLCHVCWQLRCQIPWHKLTGYELHIAHTACNIAFEHISSKSFRMDSAIPTKALTRALYYAMVLIRQQVCTIHWQNCLNEHYDYSWAVIKQRLTLSISSLSNAERACSISWISLLTRGSNGAGNSTCNLT